MKYQDVRVIQINTKWEKFKKQTPHASDQDRSSRQPRFQKKALLLMKCDV